MTQSIFRKRTLFLMFLIGIAGTSVWTAKFALAQETGEQKAEETKPAVGQEDGQDDLDKAFELKITATKTEDLDQVVELCESALKKGLSEKSAEQARELQVSTLLQHAEQFEARIVGPVPDRRWRVYRREALSRLKKAIEVKGDLVAAHLMIAKLNALDGGDKDEATNSITRVIELAGDNKSQLSQAMLIRSQLATTDEQKLNDLSQAVQINPENIEAVQARGAQFLRMGENDKALADFEKWAESDPQNVQAALLIVQLMMDLDRKDDAISRLDQFIERSPESSILLAVRAKINLDKKDNEKALADAEKALQFNKDEIEALYVRAIVLADKKDSEGALRDINRVLGLQPDSVRALWIRGLILASKREYEDAIKDVSKIAAAFPEESVYQIQLASLYNAKEEPAKAVEIYDRLLEAEPDNWEILRGRGDARLSTGEHEKAIADYEKALAQVPEGEEDDGLLNNLAWVLSTSTFPELRNGKRAIELATKACELSEWKAAHILSTLASSYAEADDFENAKKWAEKAVEVAEDDDEQKGNLVRELEAYRKGLKWRELQTPGKKEAGFPETPGSGGEKPKDESVDKAPGTEEKKSEEPKKDGGSGSN